MIYFAVSIIPLMNYDDYSKITTCKVTAVIHPTELPSLNNTNNWKECSCGKRCKSWSPCIDIYVSLDSNNIYKTKQDINNIGNECTIYNQKCKDGENILEIQKSLTEAQHIYDYYNNNTITCYQNKFNNNIIILNNEYNFNTLIVFGICIALFTLCCLFYMVCSGDKKTYSTQV